MGTLALLAALAPLSLPLLGAPAPPDPSAGKPVLADASGSEWGVDYFAQGGVVVDGVAYFTADQSFTPYWKGKGFPFGVAFDARTLRKLRTYPFKDTYDSCPFVTRTRRGAWIVVAHEYQEKRSVALNRDTGDVVWTSPANQPGSYFFGYSCFLRPDGLKLLLAPAQNGLHALSADTGEDAWWVRADSIGGVTPCVDQAKGWVYYQADGKLLKVRAADGEVLRTVDAAHPRRTTSWNTVLVNDAHGRYVATYWYDFVLADGKTKGSQWNSAIRVYDEDLSLVWERKGLPCSKKATLTYAEGKLVIGTGGHWEGRYEGSEWKHVTAYAIGTGGIAWRCDLSAYDYQVIMNVPYAYGCFYAEAWGKKSKLFRIRSATGVLEEAYDYGVPIGSCAPCLIARGRLFSGDLTRDGVIVTDLARNSAADWPGPFGDPQTNTYALPDEPGAVLVPMKEVRPPGAARPARGE